MMQPNEIYNLALHVIGLATVLSWVRKFLLWRIRPKKKAQEVIQSSNTTYYSMKIYNKHSFEHKQEIMQMSHDKLQEDPDGSKN